MDTWAEVSLRMFSSLGNSGKGENIVVAVCHFVRDKFFVFLSDEIISVLIDEQIALEGRLLVVGGNAVLKQQWAVLMLP